MPLVMIRSVVRPEKADDVLLALMDAGFPGATKFFVAGRGKQQGLKIGGITYDELAKTMIMTVISDADKEQVIKTIIDAARTGDSGNYGDGKIFVSSVGEMYTISSGSKEAGLPCVAEG